MARGDDEKERAGGSPQPTRGSGENAREAGPPDDGDGRDERPGDASGDRSRGSAQKDATVVGTVAPPPPAPHAPGRPPPPGPADARRPPAEGGEPSGPEGAAADRTVAGTARPPPQAPRPRPASRDGDEDRGAAGTEPSPARPTDTTGPKDQTVVGTAAPPPPRPRPSGEGARPAAPGPGTQEPREAPPRETRPAQTPPSESAPSPGESKDRTVVGAAPPPPQRDPSGPRAQTPPVARPTPPHKPAERPAAQAQAQPAAQPVVEPVPSDDELRDTHLTPDGETPGGTRTTTEQGAPGHEAPFQLTRIAPPEHRGETIGLDPAQGDYQLGRHEACEIRLYSPSASRRHARVVRRGDHWFLRPGAGKLVRVGRRQVESEVELRDGLRLRLGEDELKVVVESAPRERPPTDWTKWILAVAVVALGGAVVFLLVTR